MDNVHKELAVDKSQLEYRYKVGGGALKDAAIGTPLSLSLSLSLITDNGSP